MERLIKSFSHAIDGLKILITEEKNYLLHLSASLFACLLGFWLKITPAEWSLLFVLIGFVLTAETLNTSIENIMDFVCLQEKDQIRKIKDLSAAAVLISAIVAAVVGVIIFAPKLWLIWQALN